MDQINQDNKTDISQSSSNNQSKIKIPLMPINQLFKNTFSELKPKFWRLFLLTFVMSVLSSLLGLLIFNGISQEIFFNFIKSPSIVVAAITVLFTLLAIAIYGLFSLILLISLMSNERSLTLIFKKALKNFWPFIVIQTLFILAVVGGSLLLIIPGIIFAIWFIFSSYVLIEENQHEINALRRSKELVSGYTFNVFIKIFFLSFIFSMLLFILQIITQSILGLLSTNVTTTTIISSVLILIFNSILTVFILQYFYIIYKNLKTIKGASKLEYKKCPSWRMPVIVSVIVFLMFVSTLAGVNYFKESIFGPYDLNDLEDIMSTDGEYPADFNQEKLDEILKQLNESDGQVNGLDNQINSDELIEIDYEKLNEFLNKQQDSD